MGAVKQGMIEDAERESWEQLSAMTWCCVVAMASVPSVVVGSTKSRRLRRTATGSSLATRSPRQPHRTAEGGKTDAAMTRPKKINHGSAAKCVEGAVGASIGLRVGGLGARASAGAPLFARPGAPACRDCAGAGQ
jgi:hypothetical protein